MNASAGKSITLKEAKGLRPRQILYHKRFNGRDNRPLRWRVNGLPKLWKTRPDQLRVPLKHGLWSYGYLTQADLKLFSLEEIA